MQVFLLRNFHIVLFLEYINLTSAGITVVFQHETGLKFYTLTSALLFPLHMKSFVISFYFLAILNEFWMTKSILALIFFVHLFKSAKNLTLKTETNG